MDSLEAIRREGEQSDKILDLLEQVVRLDRGENKRLGEENRLLRTAIRDAGFGIMQTSAGWSIHDVSEAAKAEEDRTTQVISENLDLRQALKAMLLSADATWEQNGGGHDWKEACAKAREVLEHPGR